MLFVVILSMLAGLALPVAILYLIAATNGWSTLATQFRAQAEPEGLRMSWQSARVGWADYNNCMTFVISQNGLYVHVSKWIAWGHPPLLIPWSELHVAKVKEGWINRNATLEVGNPVVTKICLPLKVLEAASQYQEKLQPKQTEMEPERNAEPEDRFHPEI